MKTVLKKSLWSAASAVILLTGLSGCANKDALPEHAKNQFVTEFYAYVGYVKDVEFKSYVGEATLGGAAIGALEAADGNSNDMFVAALIGGAIAGIFTAAVEGNRTGYEYSLNAIDGDRVLAIVEHSDAVAGDCVLVRVAGDVFITPVAHAECEDPYLYDYVPEASQ
ncbi:hypothetical protein [Alteromonas sp. H39]|uniref:hypothetical protein n=1 Tax=Alteromonas sp. H39 TaxID=3389876 RepID=UPI0039DF4450